MSRVSLQANFYMIREDQILVANMVVINSTHETMAMNVINQSTSAATKLNTIVKIYNYKGLHEGHHFISMAMEMHSALRCDMDFSSRNAFIF